MIYMLDSSHDGKEDAGKIGINSISNSATCTELYQWQWQLGIWPTQTCVSLVLDKDAGLTTPSP
ncbi:hypothetical protein TanjilG_18312 [Lupinus angustifolius]|uniref:Uncharacterized protein n=1 Tax=Lupinus angustifolius TaxID=3871 RepID=A0A1J7H2W1_LUPAN|nr:hypothetical protein TanjilG_18312 [Lupinus angustifolius]